LAKVFESQLFFSFAVSDFSILDQFSTRHSPSSRSGGARVIKPFYQVADALDKQAKGFVLGETFKSSQAFKLKGRTYSIEALYSWAPGLCRHIFDQTVKSKQDQHTNSFLWSVNDKVYKIDPWHSKNYTNSCTHNKIIWLHCHKSCFIFKWHSRQINNYCYLTIVTISNYYCLSFPPSLIFLYDLV
jgi:hypothetical protein